MEKTLLGVHGRVSGDVSSLSKRYRIAIVFLETNIQWGVHARTPHRTFKSRNKRSPDPCRVRGIGHLWGVSQLRVVYNRIEYRSTTTTLHADSQSPYRGWNKNGYVVVVSAESIVQSDPQQKFL
jgi:hypothetical protein